MRFLFWNILLFGLWLIFSGNLHIENLIIGFFISFAITLLYLKLFKFNKFEFINPYWFFIYLLVLIKNLVLSNFTIMKKILSKDMGLSPAIVAVKTDLKSDWKKLLLANSITLTPGTLTFDIKGDILYIHTIECKGIENKEKIISEFERVIAKI